MRVIWTVSSEHVSNPDRIRAPHGRLIALPPALEGGDGFPARAVAVVD